MTGGHEKKLWKNLVYFCVKYPWRSCISFTEARTEQQTKKKKTRYERERGHGGPCKISMSEILLLWFSLLLFRFVHKTERSYANNRDTPSALIQND